MSRRRFAVLAAAALACVTVAPAAWSTATAPSNSSCNGRIVDHSGTRGTWTTYKLPSFTTGPQTATLHYAAPALVGLWFVSNGTEIMRSTDGGCSWTSFYTLPTSGSFTRTNATISKLAMPQGNAGATTLVAAVTTGKQGGLAGLGATTYILTGATELTPVGNLAAGLGQISTLAIAPSLSSTFYAVVGGVVNESKDAGATWTAHRLSPNLANPLTPRAVSELAVDPLVPTSVTAIVDGSTLLQSTDGFASTRQAKTAHQDGWTMAGLDISHVKGKLPRVSVFESSPDDGPIRQWSRSDDGGQKFKELSVDAIGAFDGAPESIAHGQTIDQLVLTTTDKGQPKKFPRTSVYGLATADKFGDIDQFELAPLRQVIQDRQLHTRYYFLGAKELVRWTPPAAELQTVVSLTDSNPVIKVPGLRALPALQTSTITSPNGLSFTIPVGQSKGQQYLVDVPPQPTKEDVFFLLDTSKGMGDVINALANAFVAVNNELVARRIDLNIGLGVYQSWDGQGIRYNRVVDISPPGAAFAEALESIETAGGLEPMYTALDQMATGSGVDPNEVEAGSSGDNFNQGSPVAPGQNANWRPGAYRVVVNVTDEDPAKDRDGGSDNKQLDPFGPTPETTIKHLAERNIHHIGFPIKRETKAQALTEAITNVQAFELTKRMAALSAGTKSFAPLEGVDCDGDGRIDLAAGAPLVCPIYTGEFHIPNAKPNYNRAPKAGFSLTAPLIAALGTITTLQSAKFEDLTAASHPGLDVKIRPYAKYEGLKARFPHLLRYSVTFGCRDDATANEPYDVVFGANVTGRFGKPVGASVTCKGPETLIVPPLAGVAAGAAPQPPANLPSIAQPAQVNQPANVSNPAANVQAGTQEEEEAALAFAGATPTELDDDSEITLAMSLLGVGIITGIGCATGIRMRRRQETAFTLAHSD